MLKSTKKEIKESLTKNGWSWEEIDSYGLPIIHIEKDKKTKSIIDYAKPEAEEVFLTSEGDGLMYYFFDTEEQALHQEEKSKAWNKFECDHDWTFTKTVYFPNGRIQGVDASYIPEFVEVSEKRLARQH